MRKGKSSHRLQYRSTTKGLEAGWIQKMLMQELVMRPLLRIMLIWMRHWWDILVI